MPALSEAPSGQRASRWRIAAWSAAALLLLIPLIAMAFTDEVNWSAADFAVAAVLILGVGVPLDLAMRKTGNVAYRAAVGFALMAVFLLVFVNGAVGIIGDEGNDVNLLFFGVVAIGVVGALLARFRPLGMALAMAVTALAQASVAAGALIAGWTSPVTDRIEIVILWVFVALWAASAMLFRESARSEPGRAAA